MDKIKNQILNKYRNCLIGIITNNMGKVKETENNFICYVDNKKLQDMNYFFANNSYKFIKKHISIINDYNLDKPVIYVFDGINLDRTIILKGGKGVCTFIVRNSSFKGFDIVNYHGDCYLSNVKINSNGALWRMRCYAKKLYINNLTINELETDCIFFDASKEIKANKLNVLGGREFSLTCPKIELSSYNINSENVCLQSSTINLEQNTYENQGKNLNDTNIDSFMENNKKLSKVKSR